MRWLSILVVCLLFSAPLASAQTDPGTKRMTTFGAKKAVTPPAASDDFRAMLSVCDEQREAYEKDAIGIPYLAAAYMALWAILLAFLFSVRRGNDRARAEMQELRVRLRALEEGTG